MKNIIKVSRYKWLLESEAWKPAHYISEYWALSLSLRSKSFDTFLDKAITLNHTFCLYWFEPFILYNFQVNQALPTVRDGFIF